ncbi:MAG: sulfatase [Planctomycetes bacterium]|nr:sulfatase [Planctomycetota bacterium]
MAIWEFSALALQEPNIVRSAERSRPNVVFFLVDDLGWRDVGCYGSRFYETPNVDRLAEDGVRFTQAYAACHVCSPTRASILTGKYPARLHLTDWITGRRDFSFQQLSNVKALQHLPYKEHTLAETLQAAGYQTAAIGKWHLGSEPSGPQRHGFEHHLPRDWPRGAPNRTYYSPFNLKGLEGPQGEYLTDRLTDEAERFIEASKDGPFFLYLAHFAVHDPIQGRADLVKKYEKKLEKTQRPKDAAFVLEGNPDTKHPLSKKELNTRATDADYSGYRVLPARTVKIKQHQDNVQFAAMVEAMDESLGRVLAKLKALELDDKTIVMFFSDNGGMSAANFGNPKRVVSADQLDRAYSTSNLPLRGAKGWLYEGGIREPMIVKWPRQGQRGAVCDVPVISTDFYPTILDLAGLPLQPKQHADGISLAPLLKGEKELARQAIYWHFPHYSNHGMQSPGGAVRAGDYKLLEYFENNVVQLFNLKDDIGEQNDLSNKEPNKVAELRTMLHAWRRTVSAQMMPPNPAYAPAKQGMTK